MKNRAQRRAEARKSGLGAVTDPFVNSVTVAVTVAPWYIRGPARLIVAAGTLCWLAAIFHTAMSLLS